VVEDQTAGGHAVAPVLDYSSGSFTDFITGDEPGADGTGADETGADGTGADETGADEDVPPGVALQASSAADNGSSGPGSRPTDPAPAADRAAGVAGDTSTKPIDVEARPGVPEPWHDAHADVLASLPPYEPGVGGPPPPARPRRRRARLLTMVLALVVLAAGGTAAALTLLPDHSSAPQAGTPSPHRGGTSAGPPASPSGPPTVSAPGRPATTLPVRASGWTSPVPVDQAALHASNAIITGVSCPQITVCYAVDSTGNVLSSTSPGTWRVVANDPNGLVAISCPTAGFCLAVDKSGDAIILSHGSWSSPVYVNARSGVFTAVSCPAAAFCMAADSGGNAFAYTAASNTWQPFTVDTSGGGLTSISCSSRDRCLAVDDGGGAYTYDGSSWSTAFAVDVGHAITAVSCASRVFCAATVADGKGAILTDGTWTVAAMGATADALACPADGFCMATTGSGGAVVYRNGAWSAVTRIDGQRVIGALSCAAPTACTAMDRRDNVLYYAPPPPG
jgi:hypothetical protein